LFQIWNLTLKCLLKKVVMNCSKLEKLWTYFSIPPFSSCLKNFYFQFLGRFYEKSGRNDMAVSSASNLDPSLHFSSSIQIGIGIRHRFRWWQRGENSRKCIFKYSFSLK
jgi:hypothetical protein